MLCRSGDPLPPGGGLWSVTWPGEPTPPLTAQYRLAMIWASGTNRARHPSLTTRPPMINYTAAEVETRNRVNAETSRIRKEASEILAPYRGSKILKGVGTGNPGWIAKLSSQLNNLASPGFRVSFSFGRSMIWVFVDATYPVSNGGVRYVKREAYVCSLIGGDTMDPTPYVYESIRTDYTVEEVTLVRTRITETQEQLDRLKSQIREFGNY